VIWGPDKFGLKKGIGGKKWSKIVKEMTKITKIFKKNPKMAKMVKNAQK